MAQSNLSVQGNLANRKHQERLRLKDGWLDLHSHAVMAFLPLGLLFLSALCLLEVF